MLQETLQNHAIGRTAIDSADAHCCLSYRDPPEMNDPSNYILSKLDVAWLSQESPKAWYPANQELDCEVKLQSGRGGNGTIRPRKTDLLRRKAT